MFEIIIPILQIADFCSEDMPVSQLYKTKRRTIERIQKQLDQIHTEVVNAEMNGVSPTHLMISWEDHAFISAYFKYHSHIYHYKYYEIVSQIMGLKVIISNVRKPKVGWEP